MSGLAPGGPFYFIGAITVAVKDPKVAARWYEAVLNLNCTVGWDMVPTGMYNPRDAANPQPQIAFAPSPGSTVLISAKRPTIFTRDMEKAHRWFSAKTSSTGPIQADSGGNQYFFFRDLDGNEIEVCLGPPK